MDCSLIEDFVYYRQTETRLGHGGHVLGRIHTKLGILWRISHTLMYHLVIDKIGLVVSKIEYIESLSQLEIGIATD